MDRAVDDVTGTIDLQPGDVLAQDGAVQIDLEQIGSGDFRVQQTVRVDQEMPFLVRHGRRDMVGNHIGHAIQRNEAIGRRQGNAGFPFRRTDAVLDRRDGPEM
jgi:hypothetical protein